MERKVLLFGLLQSLSLFASADPDLNGTSMDNGIETDMAIIEEYTRTLPMVETLPRNAALNYYQLLINHLPFGALETDWTRLHLLREVLPRDSIVKHKFDHLVRLLLVAHDQATRFSSCSESAKSKDTSENETISVSTRKEGNIRKFDEKQPATEDDPLSVSTGTTLIDHSTTASSENPIRPLSNYTEDVVDSDTMKDISRHSTGEEKSTARTDIPDTESTGGEFKSLTLFDINRNRSITKTVLKETFDRSTTRKEYGFPETFSKTTTTMDGQSPNFTPTGKNLERTQKNTDNIFSQQSSTKIVPAEETSIVDEYILAATVSTSVSSRSQPSYSNLNLSTKAEINVGSPEPVTINPKERYSTYEDYSSATTILSSETTGGRSFTSSRKEQLLLSTPEENRLIAVTPAIIPVETSVKNESLLSVKNIPSAAAEKEVSLSSKTQSQSTWEVKPSTVELSSSIEEFSTTLSAAKLSTERNVWLTQNSTESSSIDKEPKYEEIKPEKDTEFVPIGKSTGNRQNILGSTPWSTVASSISTNSTNTRHHVHETPTNVTVAKASDLPRQGQHVNKNDTSKDELVKEKIRVDEGVQDNTGIITEESTGSGKVIDKTNYIKNPLHAGSSRNNDIFTDFKHRPGNVGTDRSPESERIILHESGDNVKSGNVWRPHLVRVPPVGNNIWRFDKATENARTYGYQRPSPYAETRANSGGEPPVSSNKGPFSSRTNLLMPRKRGSANADIEKQFRWFYTQGQVEPSNKSRSNENGKTKITIRCKKTQ